MLTYTIAVNEVTFSQIPDMYNSSILLTICAIQVLVARAFKLCIV